MICLYFEGSLALPILSLDRLLIKIGVLMILVYDHHNLTLGRIGHAR